jgi:branched-chain amino acid transport system ATP-binding protein
MAEVSMVPSDQSAAAALELTNVSSGYGRMTVLRNVDIRVEPGSVTALLGPNGAGKTTLLRTVAGFLRPTVGSIRMNGTDVGSLAPHRRFRLGLSHIPEGRGIFRSLSVRDNLRLMSPKGREAESVDKALTAFPALKKFLDQPAGVLSGGQQQMVALSSAYVRQPRLILVDEPSLGLAPLVVHEIFDFLRTAADSGAALLLVDQYVTQALAMADTAYVLRRGQIVYSGAAAALQNTDVFSSYLGTG